MQQPLWIDIGLFAVAAFGQITAWITLYLKRSEAREDRTWHERKTIYVDAFRLVLEKDEVADQMSKGTELEQVRVEPLEWGSLEEARFRVFASDALQKIWDGRRQISESQRAEAIKQIRKEMKLK